MNPMVPGLQEVYEQLKASHSGEPGLQGCQQSAFPSNPSWKPALGFEAGFGSIEQRALLDAMALHAEQAAQLALQAVPEDQVQMMQSLQKSCHSNALSGAPLSSDL